MTLLALAASRAAAAPVARVAPAWSCQEREADELGDDDNKLAVEDLLGDRDDDALEDLLGIGNDRDDASDDGDDDCRRGDDGAFDYLELDRPGAQLSNRAGAEPDTAGLDTAGATALDAVALDAATLDAATLDLSTLDLSALDLSTLDAATLGVSTLDAATLDAATLDALEDLVAGNELEDTAIAAPAFVGAVDGEEGAAVYEPLLHDGDVVFDSFDAGAFDDPLVREAVETGSAFASSAFADPTELADLELRHQRPSRWGRLDLTIAWRRAWTPQPVAISLGLLPHGPIAQSYDTTDHLLVLATWSR